MTYGATVLNFIIPLVYGQTFNKSLTKAYLQYCKIVVLFLLCLKKTLREYFPNFSSHFIFRLFFLSFSSSKGID